MPLSVSKRVVSRRSQKATISAEPVSAEVIAGRLIAWLDLEFPAVPLATRIEALDLAIDRAEGRLSSSVRRQDVARWKA